jgi:hypothetical protein
MKGATILGMIGDAAILKFCDNRRRNRCWRKEEKKKRVTPRDEQVSIYYFPGRWMSGSVPKSTLSFRSFKQQIPFAVSALTVNQANIHSLPPITTTYHGLELCWSYRSWRLGFRNIEIRLNTTNLETCSTLWCEEAIKSYPFLVFIYLLKADTSSSPENRLLWLFMQPAHLQLYVYHGHNQREKSLQRGIKDTCRTSLSMKTDELERQANWPHIDREARGLRQASCKLFENPMWLLVLPLFSRDWTSRSSQRRHLPPEK